MLKKQYIFLIATIFFICGLFAQEKTLEYKNNLTISDGLAHNGITSILEDSRGFLWIGTYDGLNRYDGYDLKTYKNTLDKKILVSNRVRTIVEDENQNIWIGTDEGVSTYNYSTEQFKSIYSNKANNKKNGGPIIRKILINNENEFVICATEESSILLFKKDQTFIGEFRFLVNNYNQKIAFYSGIDIGSNNYVFTTSIGLVLFNIETKQFQRVLQNEINYSNSIVKMSGNSLLVTVRNGVVIIDINKTKDDYSFQLIQHNLQAYRFNSSLIDSIGNLWLGTLNEGLIHINNALNFKEGKPFKKSIFNSGLSVLRASSIIQTANEMCWFGTFNEGLFKFDIKENPFKKYNVEMNYDFAIQSNHVAYITPYNDHLVFLGTNRIIGSKKGGISLFNTNTEKFEPLPFQISQTDLENTGSVYVDSKKNIWLTIIGKGLFRVKNNERVLTKISSIKIADFDKLLPRSYTEDRNGNIWIGSLNDVFKISINKNDEVENIESLNNNPFFKNTKLSLVRRVYADPLNNILWLGADSDGLFRVKLDENLALDRLTVHQYLHNINNEFSISSNFVTSIIRLPNEELWVGTEGGGICKIVENENDLRFFPFSEKKGLSNNVVKSIQYDNEYNLWVATNVGLNKFDTKDLRFRRFGKSDGLPFEDFWFDSSKLKNGYFLFSGLDGLCYFKPEDLSFNEKVPRLEFGDLKIFNQSILPGDTLNNRVLFKERFKDQDKIVLKHNENVFSLQLTSLHFLNPDNHLLKYRLLPQSEEWIEVPSSQQNIYFNGLQPNEYVLSVMASNTSNKWTVPIELKITISPPFWQTAWAYLIYVLLFAIISYLVIIVILKIQSLNHKVEIEQLEVDKVKEINAAKLRFFSNISHEIKTPLTLISGPISILLERFKSNLDVKEKLTMVQRQSKKILQLVDQVHDFQRADANLLKMNYSYFCFDSFMNQLSSDFDFMAKNDHKNLVIQGGRKKVYVSADKDKLEKVFNNLLSNAFKFTKKNDTISIDYHIEGKDIIVSVTDTGKGIDSDDLSHVFERFYQSVKKHGAYTGGSGIGLAFSKRLVEMHYGYINAESEVGQGTTVTVKLPIVKKKPDNIIEEENDQVVFVEEKEELHNNSLIEKVDPSHINVSNEFSDSLVFLAEDNVEMRLFVEGVLSNFFKVKTFTNGKECLDALEEEWPDIIVSDLLMPELNGLELCKIVKSDIKTSHIPIILLTALTTIDHQIQGINEGADAYIKKPFNIQHLVTTTESLLRNRQKLRERYKIDFPLTLEKSKDSTKDSIFLEKLYSLMSDNLDNQELDLDSFAKELYLNRTHFYQKVKALTNLTPFEVLKNYRLKKAAEFLIQKQLSVNEVYVMTGFKSRTHFSKLFKEKYNCTPGKYAVEAKKKYE